MFGPVTPTTLEGGSHNEHEYYSDVDDAKERRNKMIKMQDEQILEIIKIWVQTND